MEAFITIAVFDYIHEIEILKHRLDQEGLQYYFQNEFIYCSNVLNCTWGIKLKIHPNDFASVKAILQKCDTITI
jgi:hypothetical protein